MKNKEKYFQGSETHQKVQTALKRSLFEPPTFVPITRLVKKIQSTLSP